MILKLNLNIFNKEDSYFRKILPFSWVPQNRQEEYLAACVHMISWKLLIAELSWYLTL